MVYHTKASSYAFIDGQITNERTLFETAFTPASASTWYTKRGHRGSGDVLSLDKVAPNYKMEPRAVCLEALKAHGWKGTAPKNPPRLPTRMDYHEAFRLARCLEIQLKALEPHHSFLFLTAGDLREVSPGWYAIHNMDNLVPLEKDRISITILKPVAKVKVAPELAKDLTLPHVAHKSCLYYHLGKMLLELLHVKDDLETLYGSPLYFTIKRALEPDPTKRHFLLV